METLTEKVVDLGLDDFNWFSNNYAELQKRYGDSFLSIKNRQVLGSYRSYAEAVKETQKVEKIGSFIVQECSASGAMNQACIASMHFI